MRARHPIAVLLSVLAVTAITASARADDGDGPSTSSKKDAKKSSAPASPGRVGFAGSSDFNAKVDKGMKAAAAKDFAGAINAYKDAISAEPQNAWGYYFLAEAQEVSGALADADLSLQTAIKDAKSDEQRARFQLVMADLLEREGKLEEAKGAWDTYAKLCQTAKNGTFPAVPDERKKILDIHADLAKKYGEVKARIKAREDENAKTTADNAAKDAAPPVKKK